MKKPHCGLQFDRSCFFQCNLYTNNGAFGLKLCDTPKANIFVANLGIFGYLLPFLRLQFRQSI